MKSDDWEVSKDTPAQCTDDGEGGRRIYSTGWSRLKKYALAVFWKIGSFRNDDEVVVVSNVVVVVVVFIGFSILPTFVDP